MAANPYNSPFFKALNEERKGGEVNEYIKPEPKRRKKYETLPESRIKARPDKDSMSSLYTDGAYLYTVEVYGFKRPEVRAAFILPSIFYGVSKYDAETGRLVEVTYKHTDKSTVKAKLSEMVNADDRYQLCSDQYKLYNLRVMYGYR